MIPGIICGFSVECRQCLFNSREDLKKPAAFLLGIRSRSKAPKEEYPAPSASMERLVCLKQWPRPRSSFAGAISDLLPLPLKVAFALFWSAPLSLVLKIAGVRTPRYCSGLFRPALTCSTQRDAYKMWPLKPTQLRPRCFSILKRLLYHVEIVSLV
jgi:hypothetical protein